jgi:hypothetical protein
VFGFLSHTALVVGIESSVSFPHHPQVSRMR